MRQKQKGEAKMGENNKITIKIKRNKYDSSMLEIYNNNMGYLLTTMHEDSLQEDHEAMIDGDHLLKDGGIMTCELTVVDLSPPIKKESYEDLIARRPRTEWFNSVEEFHDKYCAWEDDLERFEKENNNE